MYSTLLPAVHRPEEGLDGPRLRGPAGADAHGGVVLVHLLPEGEGELLLQIRHQLVGEDGVLLVGGGVVEHGIPPLLQGPAEVQGQADGLAGQVEVEAVLQHGLELDPQQPALGQHPPVLLEMVPEVPLEGGVGQDQGLPKEEPLLGAPQVEGVAPAGQVGEGHVTGGAHEAVAQPGPVHIEEEATVLAGLPEVVQLRQGVEGAVLRGLGEVDHPRLDHVLPGLVLPVGLPHPADVQGGELPVGAGHRQDLVAGGLDGPGLVDVDVAAGGGDDPLVGAQGGGDHRGVGLGAPHEKVDVQGLVLTQGPDPLPGLGAVDVLPVAGGLF